MKYEEAIQQLARSRDSYAGRPLTGRGTRLVHVDGTADVAVRYHATDVVTIHADGTYTLNSGGYRTMTTKARINEYSPANVWSKRGVWYVTSAYEERDYGGGQTHRVPCWEAPAVPFYDGIRIGADGVPIPTDRQREPGRMTYEEASAYLAKLESSYVRGFFRAGLEQKRIPSASISDEDDWPCCQTVDGLLYWLVSGEPNANILECALQRRGNPWHCYGMAEADLANERGWTRTPSQVFGYDDMRHWLRQRRHVLACDLAGEPVDAYQMAAYFGAVA